MLKEGFWDSLYKLKKNDAVSWYAKRLDLSLNFLIISHKTTNPVEKPIANPT